MALRGGLGAGKTTFTKGLAKGLGVPDEVTSPTFTIISEYEGRVPLYHMDAYRLSGCDEFLELGVEDLLYGDGVCVIEWSERVAAAMPDDAAIVEIEANEDGSRRISLSGRALEEALR